MARVRMNSAAVEAKVKAKLIPAMSQGGRYLADQVKQDINRGNRGGGNPSKPGEPPKKDTGRLFRSMTEVTAAEGREVVTRVGTNVEYARALEFGFSGVQSVRAHQRKSRGGKTHTVSAHTRQVDTAARPFLRPALARAKETIARVVIQALRGGR